MQGNSRQLVLIGGSGRCGTNVLRRTLDRHSAIASLPFEHRIFVDPDGVLDFYRGFKSGLTPYQADRRIKALNHLLTSLGRRQRVSEFCGKILSKLTGRAGYNYSGWELRRHFANYDIHVDRLIDDLREFRYPGIWVGSKSYSRADIWIPRQDTGAVRAAVAAFIQGLADDLVTEKDATHIADDNTWNLLFAREIQDVLPRVKFVHIYRDPRDVVASYMKQSWTPSDPQQAALFYRSVMEPWLAVKKQVSGPGLIEISLERLTAEPEEALREICVHIGLPFEPQLLEQKLDRANTDRWKADFTAAEMQIIEPILRPFISALGYE